MTIKIYPSRLESEPIETHTITDTVSVYDWLLSVNYDVDRVEHSITVVVNHKVIETNEWKLTYLKHDSDVEIYIEAKGAGLIILAVITVLAVLAVLLMPKSPKSRKAGKSLEDVGALANTARWGDAIPEIAGSPITYPDHIAPPHRYYSGIREQWIDTLLCVGRGSYKKELSQVWVGETSAPSFGDNLIINFFEPGQTLPEKFAEWWHTPEEVGFTNLGGAGMTLLPKTDITPFWANSFTFSGQLIKSNVDVPLSWQNGMTIYVEANHPVTFNGDSIQSKMLDTMQLQIGDKIQLTGSNEGVYTLSNIINGSTIEPITETTYYVAGSNFGNKTEVVAAGKAGLNYSIVSTNGVSLQVIPVGVDFWTGFTDNISSDSVVSLSLGDIEGGWIGPFVSVPVGKKADRTEVDIIMPQGLIEYDKKGRANSREAGGVIQWRFIGEEEWQVKTFSNQLATADHVGFTYIIDHEPGRVEVRVRSNRPESTDSNKIDRLQWSGLRSRIIGAPLVYNDLTLMHVKIRTGDKVSGSVENKISMRPMRILPTVEDANSYEPTRDIIPFLLYMMESVGYGRDLMDMQKLTFLHELYVDRADYFDLSVNSDSTLKTVANYALGAGFASLALHNGKISAVREAMPLGSPSRIYSPQEMTKPLISTTKTVMPDDIDGVNVEYVDFMTGRSRNAIYKLDGDKGLRVESIKAPGVTNYTKAWRIAARHRRSIAYQRTTFKGETELAALNSYYLDFVGLQDGISEYGQSAFVLSFEGNTLKLSEEIESVDGALILIFRNEDGTASKSYQAESYTGNFITLKDLDYDISTDANAMTVVYLGSVNRIMHQAFITEVNSSGNGKTTFQAKNMDTRVYAEDDSSPFIEVFTSLNYAIPPLKDGLMQSLIFGVGLLDEPVKRIKVTNDSVIQSFNFENGELGEPTKRLKVKNDSIVSSFIFNEGLFISPILYAKVDSSAISNDLFFGVGSIESITPPPPPPPPIKAGYSDYLLSSIVFGEGKLYV